MKLKSVFRFDPGWPKFRLFRLMWERGEVGAGGYSRKLAVALRPRLLSVERSWDGWRVVLMGVELHSRTSWGGSFA